MNAMKISCLSKYASLAALAAFLPLGIASSRAASAPTSLIADSAEFQQAHPQPVAWDEAKRHKLRHAYWLLEQALSD